MTPTIFLCEPATLNAAQRAVSDRWHECLFELGFDVEQLRRDAYQRDPWSGLLPILSAADGVLVLGFRQLMVGSGTWRPGTDEETEVAPAAWTSTWLHIETGMALATGVPVLVAAESKVCEGVFASDTWAGPLRGTSADTPDDGVIGEWAAAVAARSWPDIDGAHAASTQHTPP